MRRRAKSFFLAVLVGLLPSIVFAANEEGFTNPLGTIETITPLLTNVIQWLLGLVAFLALLALIVGGVRLIIGLGNEDQIRSAKRIIMWAIIGLIVVVLSYAVIEIVVQDILGVQLSAPSQ